MFWLSHFFTFLVILAEKNKVQRRKFYTGKIFDFEIFALKYVSKHSESIPTKKIFDQNFWLCHFQDFLAQKSHFSKFLGSKEFFRKKILSIVIRILLQNFQAIIEHCTSSGFWFNEFYTKNNGFWPFLGWFFWKLYLIMVWGF